MSLLDIFKPRYHLEIAQGKDGWFVRAYAKNGEILFVTESYTRREDAVRSVMHIKKARFVFP